MSFSGFYCLMCIHEDKKKKKHIAIIVAARQRGSSNGSDSGPAADHDRYVNIAPVVALLYCSIGSKQRNKIAILVAAIVAVAVQPPLVHVYDSTARGITQRQ